MTPTDTFTQTGSMSLLRTFHTANLLNDGRVLIAGGYTNTGAGASQIAEIYDPASGAFTVTGKMLADRAEHTGTTMLVCGGYAIVHDNYGVLRAAETFDPATGLFTRIASMRQPRLQFGLLLRADGRLMAVGGDYAVVGPHRIFYGDAETYQP